ncbi:hypothetical protein HUT12_24760 [Verrucosispora sp. NA02020]|nr:hypothetical protein HUT12_24760 [Verrucosispora sp. NA02020]
MLAEMVDECAPRRFAICEEYGDRADGGIFAWGLAFPDGRALVCGEDSAFTGRFRSPDTALRIFSRTGRRLRLLWIDAPSQC